MPLAFLLFWIALGCLLPTRARAETVLEKIYRTGLLDVGVREDAIPFGYRDKNNNLQGICLDFIDILRERLKQELSLEIISIKLYKSTLFNRYDLVDNRTVDLECGPNTIRELDNNSVTFSRPFFVTGTQFLVREEDRNSLDLSTLAGVNVGVLRDTSTATVLAEKYPKASLQIFQGSTGRLRGLQALQRRKIDAFASDGILLLGEAIALGLPFKDYAIVPRNPLDCEYYGFILPEDDPRWKMFVDAAIVTSQNRDLLQRWLGDLASYLLATRDYCRGRS